MDVIKNPNPTKDQHFMVDKGMLELIYKTAHIEEYESIVEIGGGEGALTDYLAQGNNYVTVIEKDPYYAAYLRDKYKDYPNVNVIEGDALNYDFSSFDRIVANLPYTITEPFLINLASSGALNYNTKDPKGSKVKSITLVLSQNSVRKMVAPVQITEGKSRHMNQEFGIMGAICKSFCDLDIVTAIPSEAFFPEPAVTSFVVNLTPKKEKTTVDRIMREILIDRKGVKPSVKRVYQSLLLSGDIYKATKHTNSFAMASGSGFTSKSIEDRNVYDLSNTHISQLVQDLIRNDVSIKSRNTTDARVRYFAGSKAVCDASYYLQDEEEEYDPFELDDLDFEEEVETPKLKFEKKYDYMYDSSIYDLLLRRGLEYLRREELQSLLGHSSQQQKY